MADATNLQDLAQEFLAACIQALDTVPLASPGLAGAPERSFVSPGQPQYDCCDDGQLTVHVPGVNSDPIGLLRNQERRNIVSLTATSLRCINIWKEGGEQPDATVAQEAAEQLNADGWALWNHVFSMQRSGAIFSLCDKVFWDGLRSIPPSGGCGGWTLNLRVELKGY